MNKKRKKILLSGLFFIFVLLFIGSLVYVVIFFIPEQVNLQIGRPDDQLDFSQRIIYSLLIFFNQQSLLESRSFNAVDRVFVIHFGDTAQAISSQLRQSKFIPDEKIFVTYLKYKGIDRRVQAGTYLFKPHITPLEIADIIHVNNPDFVKFSFLSGWRLEEISALIPDSGLDFTKEDFLSMVFSPPSDIIETLPFSPDNLEGLFLAGSYDLPRDADLDTVVRLLLAKLFAQLPKEYDQKIRENGLNIYEAITLASIIQKETVVADEAPIIASVFLNRLEKGMPLQSDPTVQYALGYDSIQNGWWKNPLVAEDLQIDSPFNTYIYNNIPPHPICSPGMNALLSVAYPATTDFYFFRSACDNSGLHIFSRTYDEHLEAACP